MVFVNGFSSDFSGVDRCSVRQIVDGQKEFLMEQEPPGQNVWGTGYSKNEAIDSFELIFCTLCLLEACYEANF